MIVLRKYIKAFTLGIQSSMEYRTAFFLELISVVFPIVMQYFLWTAIFKSSDQASIYGYSYHQIIIYTIFANLISKFVATGYFKYEIVDDIKNGGLSKYIVKPIGYGSYRLSCFLGEKLPPIIFMCFMFIIVLFVFNQAVEIGSNRLCAFMISLILALIIQFLIYFMISAVAFFVEEISHLFFVVQISIDVMSGKIIPLDMFGRKIMYLFKLLPFKYIVYYPTNIINGKLFEGEILVGFCMQCMWILILGVVSKIVWKKCIVKYIAAGG